MYNPYLLKDIVLVSHKNRELSGEINVKSALLKKAKKHRKKTLSYFSLEP